MKIITQTFISISMALALAGCADQSKSIESLQPEVKPGAKLSTSTKPPSQKSAANCLKYGDVVTIEFASAPGQVMGSNGSNPVLSTSHTADVLSTRFITGHYQSYAAGATEPNVVPVVALTDGGPGTQPCLTYSTGGVFFRNSYGLNLSFHGTSHQAVGATTGLRHIWGVGSPHNSSLNGPIIPDANGQARVLVYSANTPSPNGFLGRDPSGSVIANSPGHVQQSEVILTKKRWVDFNYVLTASSKFKKFNGVNCEPCSDGGRWDGANCFIASAKNLGPKAKLEIDSATNQLKYTPAAVQGQAPSCWLGVAGPDGKCVLPSYSAQRNYFIYNNNFYAKAEVCNCDYYPSQGQAQSSQSAAKVDWGTTVSSSSGFSTDWADAAGKQMVCSGLPGNLSCVATARACKL